MKILVTGGRDYNNATLVRQVLGALDHPVILVHGAARGADALADEFARSLGWDVIACPANWRPDGKLDKGAGVKRNQRMLDENPDIELVIAFPGGRGTADMVRRAELKGVPVKRVRE